MRHDRLTQRPAVEIARPLAGERLQRARQVRLANDPPERNGGLPASVVLRPAVVERGLGPQQRNLLVDPVLSALCYQRTHPGMSVIASWALGLADTDKLHSVIYL
jgi:hypothetical protein